MVNKLPSYRSNLKATGGSQPVVSGSGSRAQAGLYDDAAKVLKSVSDFATEIYGDRQVELVKAGKITQEDLPEPVTVVGRKMRAAFADSKAIDTNIEISNKINEITQNKALSIEGMQKELGLTAEAMINANVPEMADTIRDNFARVGVTAVRGEANRRIANQRALQELEQKTQINYWADEYSKSFVASQRNLKKASTLKEKLNAGPLPESDYIEAYNDIDLTADERLAASQSNLIKAMNNSVAAGNMTNEMAQIKMKELGQAARVEFLSFEAVDEGLSVLDDVDLTFDEKLAIAQKAANLSGIRNAEEDRAERKRKEALDLERNQKIQTAKNKLLEGDTEYARNVASGLAKENELYGDSELTLKIDKLNETIDFIAESGGPPNPEVYNKYKRKIQFGEISSLDEIVDELQFNGESLNEQELFELSEVAENMVDAGLSAPSLSALKNRIKFRLPDDEDSASLQNPTIGNIFGIAAPKTPKQIKIEAARANIEDALIEGIMDRTLVTKQQQRDFIETEISDARREIFGTEFRALKDVGVEVSDSPKDVFNKVMSMYSGARDDVARARFKIILKSQQKIKELESE